MADRWPIPLTAITAETADPQSGVVYPAWMDPRYMSVAARVLPLQILVTGATGEFIIAANPRRFILTIINPVASASSLSVMAGAGNINYPIVILPLSSARRFTLFDDGPFVTSQIYVRATAGTSFGVLEVEVT